MRRCMTTAQTERRQPPDALGTPALRPRPVGHLPQPPRTDAGGSRRRPRRAPGEFVALLGESGSGKSVTARAAIGLHDERTEVTATALEVAGHDVLGASGESCAGCVGPVGPGLPGCAVGAQPGADCRQPDRRAVPGAPRRSPQAGDGSRGRDARRSSASPARSRVDDYPHQFSGGCASAS